jgi:translation elongation factor EF-Ts
VLIELGLETWIVTQRDEFLAFARDLAMHVAAFSPESVEGMLRQTFVRDTTKTVGQVLLSTCSELEERIVVTRFVKWDNDVPPSDLPTPPRDPAVAVRLKRA